MGRDPDADVEPTAAELESVRPYLDLARAIRDEVERFTRDDAAGVESFVLALDALPRRERDRVALEVFDRLPVEAQWSVLERVFGDDELRAGLAERREVLVRATDRATGLAGIVAAARSEGRLDLRVLPRDEPVVIGLFRPVDVAAAVRKGHDSSVCARQLVLRTTSEPGLFRVVDDRFNPGGGLFVSADYDEATWRTERLQGHTTVRVGSITDEGSGPPLEPVVYAGARIDLEAGGSLRPGRLHLGFVLVAGQDVFADP